jgi:hypothetical protein
MHYIRRTTPGTPPLASMKLSVSLISLVLSTTLCAAARVASPQCAVAGAVLRVHDHNAAPAAPGQTPLSSSLMVAAQTCTSPPILSCSPDADDADTCCVVSPGGALVHTQFWDVGFGVANSCVSRFHVQPSRALNMGWRVGLAFTDSGQTRAPASFTRTVTRAGRTRPRRSPHSCRTICAPVCCLLSVRSHLADVWLTQTWRRTGCLTTIRPRSSGRTSGKRTGLGTRPRAYYTSRCTC